MSAMGLLRVPAMAALVAWVAVSPALAVQMRVAATESSDLQRGEADGIAVTSKGKLFLSPRMAPFGKPNTGGSASQTFSAAADADGNVYLGTGPDGQVLRVTAAGDPRVVFRTDEPLVTALMVLSNGDLLAASAPGGKIYKVRKDGTGSLWCDTGERYVWALAPGPEGFVLAATGERGRLLRIDRNGNSSILFDGDESHLVSLAVSKDGAVWAGGSGRGLVYRIDEEGHGTVVYDDELPEAKAIVVMPAGDVVVAFDAPPALEKRPPSLRLRMAGSNPAAGDAMSDLDARQTPAMQGVLEGLPALDSDEAAPVRGKIVRVAPEGTAVEVWRSRNEAPFALTLDAAQRPVFATGEPARLWRVDGSDEIALLATLKEAQATAFAAARGRVVAATSNPAATYLIEDEPAGSGTYLSATTDAGSVARWGTLHWTAAGSRGRVELFTRTGNSEDPDGTWSAWSPALVIPEGSPVPNPEGRFLQWRAKFTDPTGVGPRIESITASYATRNRPPTIRDLRIEPATAAVAAKATIRWSSADPDGDGVAVDVQARRNGTDSWTSAVRSDPTPSKPTDPSLGNDGSSRDGKAVWDTASWDEGVYALRAEASDQQANPDAEGFVVDVELPYVVVVDRTPPAVEVEWNGSAVEVVVEDALSPIARLEVIEGARVAFSPHCGDGVCDNKRETFRFAASHAAAGGGWSVRTSDVAGNVIETPVPAR